MYTSMYTVVEDKKEDTSNKEDASKVNGYASSNGSNDFYTDQFISKMMLRAEHPDLDITDGQPNHISESASHLNKIIDKETGLIIDFNTEIDNLKTTKPNTFREYTLLVENFKDNLRQINELEQNLIRRHMRSGKYLSDIQAWFELTFGSSHRWSNFVPYLLEQIGSKNYTIRTAQRDMMLFRNLGSYEELLVSAGNSGLAISTIYLLANPDQVSDFALDWSLGLIQEQVSQNAPSNNTPVKSTVNPSVNPLVPSQPDLAPQFTGPIPQYMGPSSVLPSNPMNLANISYNPRNQINNTKQQLTLKHAKRIAETASVIENEIDPKKRPLIKSIASMHQVVNPELVKELAKQDDETLQEIQATGHIEYPVESDGVTIQRNVHVSEASTTDLMMMRGEIDDEKHKRHLQHRIDAAKEKELLTKGIISEKVDTVDMSNIADDQHARIAAFIQQNPDLRDTLLPLMNTIRSAQGSAGVRVVVCRLSYASLASQSLTDLKN